MPVFLRQTAADKVTALYACQAITAALLARANGAGGQHLELSMADAVVSFLWADSAGNEMLLDSDGSMNSSFVAGFRPMRFVDGWGIVTPTSDGDFAGMCQALDVEGYDDPRVATVGERRKHRDVIEPIMDMVLRPGRQPHPGGGHRPLRGGAGALRHDPHRPSSSTRDEHAVAIGLFEEDDHHIVGRTRVPRHPTRFRGTPAQLRKRLTGARRAHRRDPRGAGHGRRHQRPAGCGGGRVTMPTDLGIVDLGIGFPHTSIEQKVASYDFFRANLKDAESVREMEFPVQYMFKGVPDIVPEGTDVVQWVVEKMDEFGIRIARVGLSPNGIEAQRRHPDRFVIGMSVDPNDVMGAIRRIEEAKADHDVVSAMVFPSGCVPQVAIDDPKMYPLYAKCVELDIPMCVNGGIVGPRMPSWPQQVFRFDEVCYDFPDLTIVMMHGGEPWEDLAVKLMLKWPGLHYMTSAFAPKHYPKAIIDYANTRGADKIMFCGYFPAGLTLERQFADMPNVPFRDHVWPKFLRENALRVFKIPDAIQRATGRPFDA